MLIIQDNYTFETKDIQKFTLLGDRIQIYFKGLDAPVYIKYTGAPENKQDQLETLNWVYTTIIECCIIDRNGKNIVDFRQKVEKIEVEGKE